MRFPIKYKLTGLILLIFVPLIVLSIHHYFELIEHDKLEVASHNLDTATIIAKSLDDEIHKSFALIETLSKHPAVIMKNPRECDRLFAGLLPLYSDHLNIFAVDMNGDNYCSGVHPSDIRRLNLKNSSWFQQASKGARVVDGVSTLFKVPAVTIAMPLFDNKKKQIGVLGLSLNLLAIRNDLVETMAGRRKFSVIVVDSKGVVLIDTLNTETIGGNIRETPGVKKALEKTAGSMEDTGTDGIKRLYSFAPMSKAKWKVYVGIPIEDVFDHAKIFSGHYLTLIIAVGFIVLATAFVLMRRITKNVLSLSRGMREIEKGNLNFQLKPSGGDELSDLASSFNAMTEKRNSAEQQLRKSQSFLSSVLDGIGEGLVVIDRDFKILSANKQYCMQVKLPCESIINKHCYEISHHIDGPCYEKEDGCECTVKHCFETGSHYRALHTHYDKDGNPLYIETNAYPIQDDAGNIESAIETMTDVTDRVNLEKRLEEIKERYRKLYDDAPDMMHSIGKDGTIIICNKTEAEILGYELADIIGQHFMKIIVPEERDACLLKFASIKKRGFLEGDLTLLAKDGRHIPVFMKTNALYDDKGEFLMTDAILRDVTEKKLLEAQLLHAQRMEAVGQLSGGIAHDFNNILTAVIGFGNLLKLKLGEDDAQHKYLDQILRAADRAARLTSSLLAFSRKQIVDLRQVRLSEIITRLEQLLQRVIGEDIELKTHLSPQEEPVLADSGQLEQVLMNLCANARDAMPQGGTLMIETEIVEFDEEYIKLHAFTKPGKYMFISITDTGVGMDEQTKAKIFEPFFTTKEVGKGTGLGLSMAYGIIRQHEGYINVYSEMGRGTCFKIYLPVMEEEAEAVEAKTALDFEPILTGTETILLAEDESALREYAKDVLEHHGYKVITAENGEDAVEKYKTYSNSIDLLILDVIMPKKNGKEAYDEVKRQRPDMKALFMSGYTANIIHSKGVLDVGLELIAKPFTPSSLLKKVRGVLDKK